MIKKILRDPYFKKLYEATNDIGLIVRSGFVDTDYNSGYDLNLLTTPINKLSINEETKNPVVLLATGSFNPLHEGHIKMLEKARKVLNENNYTVIGGYISPSHESYVSNTENYVPNQFDRIIYNYSLLDNNDWISIDLWESNCNEDHISFTYVIERLEQYLKKYVREDIKVAYVCGDDEISRMNVFTVAGIGVCVYKNNENFAGISNQICGPNIFYVKDDPIDISSKNIREIPAKNIKDGIYLVRDEGIAPFKNFDASEEAKINAQRYFRSNFIEILHRYVDKQIFVIKVEDEIKYVNNKLEFKNTISIDPYFNGTYNLNVSRQFPICDFQSSAKLLRESPFRESIEKQIEEIPDIGYTLVDSDSMSGNTANLISKYLKINDVFLLSSYVNEEISDCIDLKDFMFGTTKSGLVVNFNDKTFRVPYIFPYVNLYTRASIKDFKNFSKEVILLNVDMYRRFFMDMKITNLDKSFRCLWDIQGMFKDVRVYGGLENMLTF